MALANAGASGGRPGSPMPVGAMNNFTKDEILDLIAYLESAGNKEHPDFAK